MLLLSFACFYLFELLQLMLANAEIKSPSIPGCQSHCGNVTIPYPFGMEVGCALNAGFIISCNTRDFNPPKPFRGDFEVYSISDSKLRVSNFFSRQCYTASGQRLSGIRQTFQLSDTAPFTFSEANKFFLVGCDDSINISGLKKNLNFTSSCLSFCSEAGDVNNGSCSGIGCCQSSIPAGIKYFEVSMATQQNHRSVWSYNQCGYAFLGEEDQFEFGGLADLNDPGFLDRAKAAVPMVWDWAIGNLTCKEVQKTSDYVCKDNSFCVDSGSGGYRCNCSQGYDGNPYLDGCQDIDECADPNKHDCAMNCTNTPGSYYCWCPRRFRGDGRTNSTGCNLHQVKFPIVTLILGLGFGILSLFTVIPSLYLIIKRRKLIKLKEKFFLQNGGFLLNKHFSERKKGEKKSPRVFTHEELKKATNNYAEDRILGRGGSGIVYKGTIDRREVAIKKAKIVSQNQIEQFINKVIILTQVSHQHVVELIGCCLETEVPSLVYEFISNGTLSNHIHKHYNDESIQEKWDFSWENRLRIAAEAAGALAYLHSAASTAVIHGDVKSANILLDENYTAKIADFGASRIVPLDDQSLVITLVQGTFGYLDPECFHSHQLTEKSDVYSYGVVLAELLTKKRAVFKDMSNEQEINLATYFLESMEKNCLLEILEPRILSEETSDRLQEIGSLVQKCLSLTSKERPTMKEVADELEKLWNFNKRHHSGQQDHGEEYEEEYETSQLFYSAKST